MLLKNLKGQSNGWASINLWNCRLITVYSFSEHLMKRESFLYTLTMSSTRIQSNPETSPDIWTTTNNDNKHRQTTNNDKLNYSEQQNHSDNPDWSKINKKDNHRIGIVYLVLFWWHFLYRDNLHEILAPCLKSINWDFSGYFKEAVLSWDQVPNLGPRCKHPGLVALRATRLV